MSAERDAYRATATESDIQKAILDWLTITGYVVLTTGQSRRAATCPKCNTRHYPKGYIGNSTSCPDVFFRYPTWPPQLWAGVEIKRPDGATRPGQQALADAGHTFIARSLEDVQAWLRANWRLLPKGDGTW